MIKDSEQKIQVENQIKKLEKSLVNLKEKLLPRREKQFKAMASGYVNAIRELREEIDEFTGMELLNVPPKDINIHLVGPAIGYGNAPISVISKYLDNFRKSVQSIYAVINRISYKTNPPRKVINACDFSLLAFNKGSVNISLGLPMQQLNFFNINKDINKSIDLYFSILNWTSNNSKKDELNIDSSIKDKILMSMIKTLPDDKNIQEITFSGNMIKSYGKITVNENTKRIIKDMLTRAKTNEKRVILEGRIREVDLDKRRFILRDIKKSHLTQITCIMSEAVAEQPKDYLDSNVIVTGIQKEDANSIDVKLIEVKEE